MGEKPIISVTYEKERISIKNSLPYFQCVLPGAEVLGSWCYVVHGPIYGRFMGFYVNRYLSRRPHRRDVTHILSKVRCFFIEILSFW